MEEIVKKSRNRTEALASAQERYDRSNTRHISLKLNKNTDSDILGWIELKHKNGHSIQGAIKQLIRNNL